LILQECSNLKNFSKCQLERIKTNLNKETEKLKDDLQDKINKVNQMEESIIDLNKIIETNNSEHKTHLIEMEKQKKIQEE